jgi:CBS domain-containing protein
MMRAHEIMTSDVEIVRPDDTLQTAAKMMADIDAGILPVGENDRLVGVITDRDMAIRGAAEGLDPKQATVREVMTEELRYCMADDDVENVSGKMASWQVRRLPVLNDEKRLVGIISIGDLVIAEPERDKATEALAGVSDTPAKGG